MIQPIRISHSQSSGNRGSYLDRLGTYSRNFRKTGASVVVSVPVDNRAESQVIRVFLDASTNPATKPKTTS